MISKEDYAKAKETVDEYEKELNAKLIDSYTCLNCKEAEITAQNPEYINPLMQGRGMWSNGTVIEVGFGFGSRHDMCNYYVAICDNCIEELEASGLAVNKNNIRRKIKNGV